MLPSLLSSLHQFSSCQSHKPNAWWYCILHDAYWETASPLYRLWIHFTKHSESNTKWWTRYVVDCIVISEWVFLVLSSNTHWGQPLITDAPSAAGWSMWSEEVGSFTVPVAFHDICVFCAEGEALSVCVVCFLGGGISLTNGCGWPFEKLWIYSSTLMIYLRLVVP